MPVTRVANEINKKSFSKKDFSAVTGDWTGTESYWTDVANSVYTTVVGTDPGNVQIRYTSTSVDSSELYADIEFPDSDEWSAGVAEFDTTYATITKREIHIFEKVGGLPTKYRIDAYNGATLLCSYYLFRDFSENSVYKWGLRIRHAVAPSSFSFYYDVSDDAAFEDYGIVVPGDLSDSTSNPADVVGNTYYFSIPTAYLPEGRALIGGANDYSARLMSFAAFLIAVFAIIYILMNNSK
jgi:hypothetical protein